MLKVTKVYSYICDRCGKDSANDQENVGWNDKGYAWECAADDDWEQIDDKEYCPDCYERDDDDELIVKEAIK